MSKQFDQAAFEKQLNIFGDAIETDLSKRNSEIGKKWEFDFEMGEPFAQSSWEQTAKDVDSPQTRPTLIPAVQEIKPRLKLSLGNFSEGGKLFKSDVFSRTSNLGSTSQITESTAADSMMSSSGVKGFSKFSDVAIINNNTGRRTSIAN